ncbi:antibiotic biosynthesis monooxygenase family protein [Pseudomonas huanghezhanensis]|uniref:antibiotic biosynthesis monooxygenase family protein n=1 Tax=Pseudomonas huanghezhanensis TaxID=3002903 RepID=UPI0022864DC3|nr:antibiotic biosynthesis monooxygenase [Pseudomonas sp. BSw22131]
MIIDNVSAPCYAVIFTSIRTDEDPEGYSLAAQRMLDLARQQPGFLGVESAREEGGVGITVSYWSSEAAILAWKHHPEHAVIRERGRSTWYQRCTTRVAKVERHYGYNA